MNEAGPPADPPREITVLFRGKTIHGTYVVNDGEVTVSTALGEESMRLGSMPAELLAQWLLLEMARVGKA